MFMLATSGVPCWLMKFEMMSMGTGKTMVLLCSAEMLLRVWRYLN